MLPGHRAQTAMPLKLQNTHKHFGNNRPQAVVKATEVILITDTRHCDKTQLRVWRARASCPAPVTSLLTNTACDLRCQQVGCPTEQSDPHEKNADKRNSD